MNDPTEPVARPYRVQDLAGLLDCSVQHVRRMVRGRLIPGAFRVGRLIRFRREMVDAWLAARVSAGDGSAQGGG